MIRFAGIWTLIALAASPPAGAAGALAVGSTSDVVGDGIAVGSSVNYPSIDEAREAAIQSCHGYARAPKAASACAAIGTFHGECYAVSYDPKPGTPGAGWAIAASKDLAEERALESCQAAAGPTRRDQCRIAESKCDEN